uniref:Uncharacterized protein n=1 Tax=Ciona savignyi TaxID=51511 RepID=H2Y4X3_CIOSA
MEELIHVNNEKVSTSIEKLGNDSSLPAVNDMEIKVKPRLDLDSFEPYEGIDGAEKIPESNSPHHETTPTEENTKTTPSSGEIRPLTPDSVANVSSCSSPMTPRGDSSSAPSTPRDGSSSGSPSPIPDDTPVDGEMA